MTDNNSLTMTSTNKEINATENSSTHRSRSVSTNSSSGDVMIQKNLDTADKENNMKQKVAKEDEKRKEKETDTEKKKDKKKKNGNDDGGKEEMVKSSKSPGAKRVLLTPEQESAKRAKIRSCDPTQPPVPPTYTSWSYVPADMSDLKNLSKEQHLETKALIREASAELRLAIQTNKEEILAVKRESKAMTKKITEMDHAVSSALANVATEFSKIRESLTEGRQLANDMWSSLGRSKKALEAYETQNRDNIRTWHSFELAVERVEKILKEFNEGRLRGGKNNDQSNKYSRPFSPNHRQEYEAPNTPSPRPDIAHPIVNLGRTATPPPPPPKQQQAESRVRKENSFSCVFCTRPAHQSEDCHTVGDWVERRNLLMSASRCFKCLNENSDKKTNTHPNCPKAHTPCNICGHRYYGSSQYEEGLHHVAICPERYAAIQRQKAALKGKPSYPNKREKSKGHGRR